MTNPGKKIKTILGCTVVVMLVNFSGVGINGGMMFKPKKSRIDMEFLVDYLIIV